MDAPRRNERAIFTRNINRIQQKIRNGNTSEKTRVELKLAKTRLNLFNARTARYLQGQHRFANKIATLYDKFQRLPQEGGKRKTRKSKGKSRKHRRSHTRKH